MYQSSQTQRKRIATHQKDRIFINMIISSIILSATNPQSDQWHFSGLCVRVSADTDGPYWSEDSSSHPPSSPPPPLHIMLSEINARQARKVASQKFELKKSEEEKTKKIEEV